MKLYFSPGACSLSPHIVANELGIKLQTEKVDLSTHKTSSGQNYYEISAKGAVPALQLDDGTLITEGAVINQYLCDNFGGEKMLPKVGSPERYNVLMWLNYVATELHKGFSPLFGLKYWNLSDATVKEFSQSYRKYLSSKYEAVEKALSKTKFLAGDTFSPADAYLFTVTGWAKMTDVDLTMYPKLMAFMETTNVRPSVRAAIMVEKGGQK